MKYYVYETDIRTIKHYDAKHSTCWFEGGGFAVTTVSSKYLFDDYESALTQAIYNCKLGITSTKCKLADLELRLKVLEDCHATQ